MPTTVTLQLARPPQRPLKWRFDVQHAIACTLFETPATPHQATRKPFTINAAPNPQTLTFTWLDDHTPIPFHHPTTIQIGDENIPVTTVVTTHHPYEHIEKTPAAKQSTLIVQTPAHFKHNGHDYPLPDPFLIITSLALRYRHHRPEWDAPETTITELARSTMISQHRIQTHRFPWHGHTGTGFTGQFTLKLPRTTPPELHHHFTTLTTFTTHAGLGRGTTHGLGTTQTTPT